MRIILLAMLAMTLVTCGKNGRTQPDKVRWTPVEEMSQDELLAEEVAVEGRSAQVARAISIRIDQDARARNEAAQRLGFWVGVSSLGIFAFALALWVASMFYAPLRSMRPLFYLTALTSLTFGAVCLAVGKYFYWAAPGGLVVIGVMIAWFLFDRARERKVSVHAVKVGTQALGALSTTKRKAITKDLPEAQKSLKITSRMAELLPDPK